MKFLILLILAGKLLVVNAPANTHAPDIDGVTGQMYAVQDALLVYAHEDKAGGQFYELNSGDTVTAVFDGGISQKYVVSMQGVYIARSTEAAKNGGDFEVRLNNQGEWMMLTEVIDLYSKPNNIVLITCSGGSTTTGRLFVELAPVEVE